MKKIDLIIFDLDGTLVDSKKDIVDSVNFMLKKLGLDEKEESEITSYIGTGVQDLLRKSLGKNNERFFRSAMRVFEGYYEIHHSDHSSLYPGVKEVLEYFTDKKKAVITNRKQKFASLALKNFGIERYFESIIGGDNLLCLKPAPCPLDKIVRELKAKREKTLIVGDMDIDIMAGTAARITTCAVTYGIGKKKDIIKARPDFIIDDILDLKNIVKT